MDDDISDNGAALLLTASIDIKGMPQVARLDPQQRQDEYAQSLAYWLQDQPSLRRIVFVENSGWPLDAMRTVVEKHKWSGKEVELISLNCNDYPRERGKGYGEFLMIDQALEHSTLARSARYVVKLTGRAIVTNIDRLLSRVNRPFDLLCDLRDHGIYQMLGVKASGKWCDTRLFAFTLPFYEANLRGQYEKLDWIAKGTYLPETLLYDVTKEAMSSQTFKVIPRFPIEPRFVGSPAHWNKSYDSGRERAKRAVRGALRRVAPWLYI